LEELGFSSVHVEYPDREIDDACIADYDKLRDFPAANGTTRIGIHLRFGTVSVRKLVLKALQKNTEYLNELIWREFYMMILWHFPHIAEGKAFRNEYDRIEWRNNEDEFQRWCEGTTGYPMVDAGMRQLNATGYMHNRVRMVAASFLSKHLLIDWRWGEAYFASKLLDYDFASNNGGWQWAAGSGCDAAPYFRIFNPLLQAKKFDPKGEYIRKWVPDVEQFGYPSPLVDHDFARKRCLAVYGRAIKRD
jgi:deoxyribodipyrimidine photo-lyase